MTKNNKQQTSNFILSEEYRKINIGFFWRGFLKNIPVRRRRPGLREWERLFFLRNRVRSRTGCGESRTSFCRQLKPGKNFYISNQMNTVRHRDSFCPRNQAGRYDSGSGPAAAGPGFSGFPHGNGKRMHPQRFPGPVPGTGPCVSANS